MARRNASLQKENFPGIVSSSHRRSSTLSARAVAAGGLPRLSAMYRMIRSRSASASGEMTTSYMVFLPNGGEGCTCGFALASRNLPFGGCDLLVQGQFGKCLVEELGTDDDGRAVSVFGQVDWPILDFILDFGILVPKVGNWANASCDHNGFLSSRCRYYITTLSEVDGA